MKLDDWKVIEKDGRTDCYYTDIPDLNTKENRDKFEEEFGESTKGMRVVPYGEWDAEMTAEILGNCMEDCNMHGCLYWPRMVLDAMKSVPGMDDSMRADAMRNIAEAMQMEHLY